MICHDADNRIKALESSATIIINTHFRTLSKIKSKALLLCLHSRDARSHMLKPPTNHLLRFSTFCRPNILTIKNLLINFYFRTVNSIGIQKY